MFIEQLSKTKKVHPYSGFIFLFYLFIFVENMKGLFKEDLPHDDMSHANSHQQTLKTREEDVNCST